MSPPVLDMAMGRLSNDVAIDLGTSTTLVFVHGRGIVVEEPSVVAIRHGGSSSASLQRNRRPSNKKRQPSTAANSRVVAIGREAKQMLGRTPENIAVVHPIQCGSITNFPLAESLFRECVQRAMAIKPLMKPRMVVCVPLGISDVEQRAIADFARAAGAKEVALVGKSTAAAVGTDLPIELPKAHVIVDIGGGSTEIAVISMGSLIAGSTLPVGGDSFDQSITEWVQRELGVLIGESTAEEIKHVVGCAYVPDTPSDSAHVPSGKFNGRDDATGIPRSFELTRIQAREALNTPLVAIVEELRRVLSSLTPELAGDIAAQGVILSGGSSLLPEMPNYLRRVTGLAISMADDPMRATVTGAGRLLDNSELLARVRL